MARKVTKPVRTTPGLSVLAHAIKLVCSCETLPICVIESEQFFTLVNITLAHDLTSKLNQTDRVAATTFAR